MRPRSAAAVVVAALCVLTAAGCSSDGREMRPPGPDQTASIRVTTTTGPVTTLPVDPVDGPALSLPWIDGQAIPVDFTCQGLDVSPAVAWSALPEGTAEVAIVMTDPAAGGFVHWIVSGLDPALGQVAQDGVPEDATQSANDFGGVGYKGPCPLSGIRNYFVTLYALREPAGLSDGGDPAAAITRLDELQLASVTQTGTFPAP